MAPSGGISTLSLDSLASVVGRLESARDVAALACSCRDAAAACSENSVWTARLRADFALPFAGVPASLDARQLYRQLKQHLVQQHGSGAGQSVAGGAQGGSAEGGLPLMPLGTPPDGRSAVSFQGLYTSGGLDDDDPAFWVSRPG
jgi:hypothetical protein